MSARRIARSTTLFAAMALTAACGTTVDGADEALRAGGAGVVGDGFTVDTALDSADGQAPAVTTGPSAPASGPGSSGARSGPSPTGGATAPATTVPHAGGTPTTAPTSGGPPSGPVGPGVTDSTIKIGMVYDKNAGALNSAYGFAGLGQVDQKLSIELLRDHVNASGGVAGRNLEIVWYVTDQLSGKTAEQVAQEACATWTQDNEIFAALAAITIDTLNACLSDAGVVHVGGSAGLAYREVFRRFPHVVALGDPALESVVDVTVDTLGAQGFYEEARPEALGAPIKIGLVVYDDPAFKAGAARMEAALGARGLELSEQVFVKRGETPDQIGSEVNAVRAAALRFKERGVTHVHFLMTANGFGQFTFWQNADSLRYEPRYGLTSLDVAQALIPTFESSNPGGPGRQFPMALGVGWSPLADVPRADYSGDAESPELRRCKSITEPASDGGFNDAGRNKELIAASLCDTFFYFQAAVDAGGSTPSTESWLRGVASISGMGSAYTFVLRTDRQRDAVGAVRSYAFHDDCTCFHYTSPTRGI